MKSSKKQDTDAQRASKRTINRRNLNLKKTSGNALAFGEITTEEIPRIARKGISGEEIQYMVDKKLATTKDVAYVLGVNERTVRTYQREASNLSPQQSEQLLKYNRLLRRGKEVFGSDEAFDRWLRKPAYGLDNDVPLAYLVTSEGINLVNDEVERIANGEFA
jgi:putative toxin-antitoxin system antitoxin component (TIGR02293 family)